MKDNQFFKYVRDFLTVYLPKQRNYSANTIKSYRECINLLRLFLKEEKHIPFQRINFETFTRDLIYEYLEWLQQKRKCSVSTRNQRLAVIKSFLLYASTCDITLCNLYMDIKQIKSLRNHKQGISYFSKKVLKVLLSAPNINKRIERRNQFLMILMYDTGARIQEILDLRLKDFALDFDMPSVYLTGKGGKVRSVPLTDSTLSHLKHYIEEFHPTNIPDSPLFYTVIHGQKAAMSPDTVSTFLKKYAKLNQEQCAEMPERIHPHMFRHSKAMHLYQSGIPLSYIKNFLGHSNINTTNIYAFADTSMIKDALEKVSHLSNPTNELPIWTDNEEMLLQLCGLK